MGAEQYRAEKVIGGREWLFVRKYDSAEKQVVCECFKESPLSRMLRWSYFGTFDTVRQATAEVKRLTAAGNFER